MMERNKVFLIATQTYYESYHGKVESLGYPRLVAGCADCHGFHSILEKDNPKSLISDAAAGRDLWKMPSRSQY